MSILGKKALLGLLVPFAKDVLPKLATKATWSALDNFKKKINGARAVRAGKGFTSFISNEDMDDIFKIVETPEESGQFIDGETETVKHEIKKQEGQFIGAMMVPWAASLISLLPCPLINTITGKWVTRAGKGEEDGTLPLLALPLVMKGLGKRVTRSGRGYNNTAKNF